MTGPSVAAPRGRVARRAWVWGVAALIVLIAALLFWPRDDKRPVARRAAATGPTNAASSMPGMDMPATPSSTGTVQLTSDQIRQFGITFGTVETRTLANEVRTVGLVTVDSTRLEQMTPKFGGYVERLHVNAAGQSVRRGEPLMEVYSPELVAAEQELLVAANLQRSVGRSEVPGVPASGTDLVAAARQRLALWDVSDAQIAEILRTGRVRRTLTLYAPASGVVLDKNVVQGQAIQPGQMLYTIADLGTVWVDAQLREADAAAIREGAGADVEVAALPGRRFKGRVTYVYPTLDPQARTVRARVSVANSAGLLRPGMYATVVLASPTRAGLTVPSSAVLRTGERNLVFVDMGGGRLQAREVEVGRVAGDQAEVLSGLRSGQRVVTSAQFLLDSESNLGEVMRSMIGQGAMGSGGAGAMTDMPGMPGMPMTGPMGDKGADMRGMTNMSGKAPPTTRPRR